MKVSGHFNNCIMIIGWPMFRLERYFLGRKRNFLLHFARKSLHHHSIILVISDKHTHTGLMCRNTNHSRVTQTCRLSPLCYVHFSSIALVFVFSIVQNWTELVVIIPYLRGPSPFKKMEREWENGQRMRKHRCWTHMIVQSKPIEQMMCQNSEEITPKTHFNWKLLSSQLNHSEMSPKLCLQILTLFLSPEENVGPAWYGRVLGRTHSP